MTKKLHYISGITISLFVGIHLINHLMLFQGEQIHITFMETARKFYRNAIVETILLIAVATQVISGIQLLRRKWGNKNSAFDKLQIYSGWFLSYFLVAHVSSVLIGRYILQLDTNLYFGASVLNNFPAYFYFVIHYGGAVIAFFTHVACIHKVKISTYITEKQARTHAYAIMGVGITLSFLIVYKMMQVTIPVEYQFLPFGKY